ncbi:NDP-glycosyltransferase YjiC-like [Oppia nitens]|uniref:NDP-glycosyltransferase YjiC-like n=1 Tax=Oppia nitens TaxID=1686743 RepID=UPI0023D9FF56|nr:NDP-glycosyltransferase YjiC-like [Oppia nitens]
MVLAGGSLSNGDPVDKLMGSAIKFMAIGANEKLNMNVDIKQVINDVKPDLIVVDHMITIPSIVTSGIPWISSWSNGPLTLDWIINDYHGLPPGGSGLPTNYDKVVSENIRHKVIQGIHESWVKYNNYLVANGCPELKPGQIMHPSPYANIYMTPKELDYTDVRPLPDNFYGFDYYKRSGSEQTFEIPEQLRDKPGKLIYFSLGSMGSANVDLMKRLINILAKSPNRFIVSKGMYHNTYSLPDNMWGERTVPQIQVLSICDLVLTHGGNNTVTESMFYGKPMIVLPLFFDQHDNGQRLTETGLGVRLNPFTCTDREMLDSIDRLLTDQSLAVRLTNISHRIQTERRIEGINNIIDNIVNK